MKKSLKKFLSICLAILLFAGSIQNLSVQAEEAMGEVMDLLVLEEIDVEEEVEAADPGDEADEPDELYESPEDELINEEGISAFGNAFAAEMNEGFTAFSDGTATKITKLNYEVTISGIEDETELLFWARVSSYQFLEKTIDLTEKGNGNYEFTLTPTLGGGADGILIFGEIGGSRGTIIQPWGPEYALLAIPDSNIKMTIVKLTINDDYDFVLNKDLWAGNQAGNKYDRPWEDDGFRVATSTDGKAWLECVAFGDGDKQARFYIKDELPPIDNTITSLKYDFTVSGINDEEQITVRVMGNSSGWSEDTKTIPLTGNGSYYTEFSGLSFTELFHLGELGNPASWGNDLRVRVDSITVNGEYEMIFDNPPILSNQESWTSSLPSIWAGLDDATVICKDDNDIGLVFYEIPAGGQDGQIRLERIGGDSGTEPDPNAPKLTTITSIEYTYEFDVSSFDINDDVCIRHTPGTWANTYEHLLISDLVGPAYEYTYTWTFPATSNFYHLGRFGRCSENHASIHDPLLYDGAGSFVTLTKMIASDGENEYEFEASRLLDLTEDGHCSIGNAWMADAGMTNGDILYESTDGQAFFEYNDQSGGGIKFYVYTAPLEDVMTTDRSIDYAADMGNGWNLGNSFDAVNTALPNLGGGETAWNNPVVVRELIQYVKDQGFEHIRIPMTAFTRFTDKGAATPDNEIRFELNAGWLARYKEVVQWAVDEGLYVMINLHHDSNRWFEKFADDGSPESNKVLRTFEDLWKQLAAEFATMPDSVMFETINEPEPDIIPNGKSQQERLNTLNRAAFDIIRATPGNETRMIVISSIYARFSETEVIATREFIRSLDDENILATVHFYHPTYEFSVNLGETMYGSKQRAAVETFFRTLEEQLIDLKVGVNIGEWGLLAYDDGHPDFDGHIQHGEELKYYEHVKFLTENTYGVNLSLWDNGSNILRWDGDGPRTSDFTWRFPRMGEIITGSGRFSYTTSWDTAYYDEETIDDLNISLTLNGNTFIGIAGLTEGTDYSYSAETISLKKEYINDKFQAADGYGIFDTLILEFNNGSDWEFYLRYYGTPEYGYATGSRSAGITVPLTFNGARVNYVQAFINNSRVGHQQDWAPGLQYADTGYKLDYKNGSISHAREFFNYMPAGPFELEMKVTYFDGQTSSYVLEIDAAGGVRVKGTPVIEKPNNNNTGSSASSPPATGGTTTTTAPPAGNYGHQPGAPELWNLVNKEIIDELGTGSLLMNSTNNASDNGFDYVLNAGKDILVPNNIVSTLQGTNATLMLDTGAGVTFSISGNNIPEGYSNENFDLSIRDGSVNAPAAKVAEVLAGTIANIQIPMVSREDFGMVVGQHFNVGAENAGNFANLYRFNEVSGEFEYLGSYEINEKGQAMFGITGGADYVLTISVNKPNLPVVATGIGSNFYTVVRGDNLSQIARRHGLTLPQIRTLNPQITNPSRIQIGQIIRVR